jgi:hypothetical protein
LSSADRIEPTPYGSSKSKSYPSTTSRSAGSPSAVDGRPAAATEELDDSDVDCDARMKAPKAACAMQEIKCGDTVQGTNKGQGMHFGDAFYRAKFCTPRSESYDESPDAVYALTVPANMLAEIRLASPCEDLDLFSVRWSNDTRCPSVSTNTGECEASTKTAGDKIRIVSVGRDEEHLVWVDGKRGSIGNFELRVDCRPAR